MSSPDRAAANRTRQTPAATGHSPFEALEAKGFNISFQAHAKSIL